MPTLDIGKRSDVILNLEKEKGIENAIRALKPDIIALDEIGFSDISAVLRAFTQGVSVFATAHGNDVLDVLKRLKMPFEMCVLLDKVPKICSVKKIYDSKAGINWQE